VFKEEVKEGGEGYLYAKIRYGHEWEQMFPWWMTLPETDKLYTTPGIYLGFKGGVGVELAWVKEQAARKGSLLMKELGL
jgi:hypothetical protein